jgi:hypothetical protein
MSYVPVPVSAFEQILVPKGFTSDFTGPEVVFTHPHAVAGLAIKVYTACGKDGDSRGCGEDAIRVCLVYIGAKKERGLAKSTRVHRTGSPEKVVERVLERARTLWKHAYEFPGARPRVQ